MKTKIIQTIETFNEPRVYTLNNMVQKEPSVFNTEVSIRRYKITVEEIIEPNEVLAERIQKLWDECDNHHYWQPLKSAAKEIGYEIKVER